MIPAGPSQDAPGLLQGKQSVSVMKPWGNDFDCNVGFPGATDYLASNLPVLGRYLTDLAASLGGHKR